MIASALSWASRTAPTIALWASLAFPRRNVRVMSPWNPVAVTRGKTSTMMSWLARRGPEPALCGSQAWSPPATMVESETDPSSMQAVSTATLTRSLVRTLPLWSSRPARTRHARRSLSAAAMPAEHCRVWGRSTEGHDCRGVRRVGRRVRSDGVALIPRSDRWRDWRERIHPGDSAGRPSGAGGRARPEVRILPGRLRSRCAAGHDRGPTPGSRRQTGRGPLRSRDRRLFLSGVAARHLYRREAGPRPVAGRLEFRGNEWAGIGP